MRQIFNNLIGNVAILQQRQYFTEAVWTDFVTYVTLRADDDHSYQAHYCSNVLTQGSSGAGGRSVAGLRGITSQGDAGGILETV